MPSIPGLPWLAFTRRKARFRFSLSQTSSINCFIPAGLSVSPFAVSDSVPPHRAFGASLLPSTAKASTICSWFFCRLSFIESRVLLAAPCCSGLQPCGLSGRRRRAVALASVRRPNCTYSFPVCSFHEDSDVPRCKRRNQPDQVHKSILPVQRRDGKLLPPTITPTLKSMRPDPPHDPAVELVEEHSDVGSFVILAPSPQERIELRDQLLGVQWHSPFGSLSNLVLKTMD